MAAFFFNFRQANGFSFRRRCIRILKSNSYGEAFHDIKTGNNSVTGFDVNGNPFPIIGYNAGPGWDAVTGVGTPKVTALAALLKKYS